MRIHHAWTLACLTTFILLLGAPMAGAQETQEPSDGSSPTYPEEVDVDIREDEETPEQNVDETPEEAVGPFGLTTLLILLVLAVVVIGLIVALATRR